MGPIVQDEESSTYILRFFFERRAPERAIWQKSPHLVGWIASSYSCNCLGSLTRALLVVQCGAVCCSVVKCFAVCCSVSQYSAVSCSVLQYVAVCCSESQCVAAC